jgi:hypothetical protein
MTVLKMIHGYKYMIMGSCPLLKTDETIITRNTVDHYSFCLINIRFNSAELLELKDSIDDLQAKCYGSKVIPFNIECGVWLPVPH